MFFRFNSLASTRSEHPQYLCPRPVWYGANAAIHCTPPHLPHFGILLTRHPMSDAATPPAPLAPLTMGVSKTPAEFLKAIKGQTVLVKLNSGVDYRGVLACLDGYMNIAMEQTEVGGSLSRSCMHAPILHACALSGVRQRAIEEQVWRCIHSRKQWWDGPCQQPL